MLNRTRFVATTTNAASIQVMMRILFLLVGLSMLGMAGCATTAATASLQDGQQAGDVRDAARIEVNRLAEDSRVKAAFADIRNMDERNITRLIEITEIPAPPFAEGLRVADLAERLKTLGIVDVSTDEEGNVIARRPGASGNRTVAVVAHIDTVFPAETDVTVRRDGDTFYAPGIGDNTRGLVVLLSLVEVLEKHQIETHADVLFIGSVGEEGLGDLRGVRHLFREGGERIDSLLAIDGGRPNRVVTTGVGSNRYRVTFEGPGGHSYGAFGRAHPHQALGDAIARFTKNAEPLTQDGTKATFSVGRIGGGTSINSIPFASWMEVDMRSADPQKLADLDAAFQQAVQDALAGENARLRRGEALTVDIESVGKRPAGRSDPDSTLVQFAGAALLQLGLTPDFVASSTDANIPMSLGIPALTMSRGGRSQNAHAPNESWQNIDSHVAIQAILLTLLAESGYANAGAN